MVRIGVDIGGTFTDLYLLSKDGKAWSTKMLTTTQDPSIGFLKILEKAFSMDSRFREVQEIVHATTVATNAILEGKTACLGMITTAGFRDVLEIGRHFRRDLYNFFLQRPAVLVPRQLRLEVNERIAADGSVVKQLDEQEIDAAITQLLKSKVEVILVCFLHSYLCPDHELRVGEMIRRRCNLPVILSHHVCSEYREYERFSTAAVHGAVMPLVQNYLRMISRRLKTKGVTAPLSVMQSSGGITMSEQVVDRPASIVESGPAAGVISAVEVGRRLGFENFITFDMGGTTTKASLVRGGHVTLKTDYEVGGGIQGGFGTGYPLRTPVVDVVEIGTGGGSICFVDEAGHLHVGPNSAGADPGPCCYDCGGKDPTITDAHAVLGRLRADNFAGGQFMLNVQAARNAIQEKIAKPLGMEVVKAAEGILALANAQMVRALQLVSIERGYDPRDLTLVAFGGAGPMHAAQLSRELGCSRVVVPPEAGVQSAWGLLVSDCRRDSSQAFHCRADQVSLNTLKRLFQSLTENDVENLNRAGFSKSTLQKRLAVDVRYVGQAYEITVEFPDTPIFKKTMMLRILHDFHEKHQRLYGHNDSAALVEIVTVRASVTARVPRPALRKLPLANKALQSRRYATQGITWSGKRVESPVYHRANLFARDRIFGGALIIQEETTIVVPPKFEALIGTTGDIILTEKGAHTQ